SEAHAGDFPLADRSDGRNADVSDADERTELRARRRRHDHSRAWWRTHGRRSHDISRERQLSGARREESVRRRRKSVRVAGRQESDVDDPGAVVENERIHRAAETGGGTMTTREEGSGKREAGNEPEGLGTALPTSLNRREALKVLGVVP